MVAADLLVKEHRLIERIIPILTKEVLRLHEGGEANAERIVSVVGFFRTYADRCHHGKEEDILFRALASKPLSDEHRRTMDQLTEEHVLARKLVGRLMLDQGRCVKGDQAALAAMKQDIQELADLYPQPHRAGGEGLLRPVHGLLQRDGAGRDAAGVHGVRREDRA